MQFFATSMSPKRNFEVILKVRIRQRKMPKCMVRTLKK